MGEIHYEGEELYEKKMEEDLFEMDRFDPAEEGHTEDGEAAILDKLNKKLKDKRKLDGKDDKSTESKEEPDMKKRKRSKKKKSSQEPEGFTVLGDTTDNQKKKVSRVLPQWLAQPDILQVTILSPLLLLLLHFCSCYFPGRPAIRTAVSLRAARTASVHHCQAGQGGHHSLLSCAEVNIAPAFFS